MSRSWARTIADRDRQGDQRDREQDDDRGAGNEGPGNHHGDHDQCSQQQPQQLPPPHLVAVAEAHHQTDDGEQHGDAGSEFGQRPQRGEVVVPARSQVADRQAVADRLAAETALKNEQGAGDDNGPGHHAPRSRHRTPIREQQQRQGQEQADRPRPGVHEHGHRESLQALGAALIVDDLRRGEPPGHWSHGPARRR